MKNLYTITVLIILVALSGCISVRSGGSPSRQAPQGTSGATDKVIIVSAASSASSSTAAMTTDGRAIADERKNSKAWEFNNLALQSPAGITYIDNLTLSVSERGDTLIWHTSFDVRSRVRKVVSPDVVFNLILLDRNGQELTPNGQISFSRLCGNSYYEKSDSVIAPDLFKQVAGARIKYIFKTRVTACD
ncbi:hypothetical protein [Nitrosospira briensis]|uniref:hypothetical protein n=1 Tax=Nitrosospira briensis TaxID=35799 RepID=UPI0004687378|nr:hypothetical protein [Nitrosospira briensis]